MQKATTNYRYVSASGVLAPKNSYCHSTSTSSSVELRAFIGGRFPMTDRRRTWSAKNLLAGLKNLYPCLFICLSSACSYYHSVSCLVPRQVVTVLSFYLRAELLVRLAGSFSSILLAIFFSLRLTFSVHLARMRC